MQSLYDELRTLLSGGFNTASGMDCMQFDGFDGIPALLAGFNTASGMDCMQ